MPKRAASSATTQKISGNLLPLSDSDRPADPKVRTTLLVMMRVRLRTITELLAERP